MNKFQIFGAVTDLGNSKTWKDGNARRNSADLDEFGW